MIKNDKERKILITTWVSNTHMYAACYAFHGFTHDASQGIGNGYVTYIKNRLCHGEQSFHWVVGVLAK